MPITLNGATSGSVTLEAPAVAGTTTLTLPATSGTVVTTTSPSLTTPTMTSPTISSGNLTFSDSTAINSANNLGMRNRIINGDMRIDQRNAGASLTITTAQPYTLDRWVAFATVTSKYSVQQNAAAVTPPAGFTNYLGVTSLAATSLSASDYYFVCQKIEGYNCADLGFGAAGASTVTVSFWVRSSLTGTFGGALNNGDSTRAYPFTYTINSANTWEQKTLTIAGDTSGTWNTTNGKSVIVIFGLGVGSTGSGTAGAWAGSALFSATGATSVVGTNGATWYVTGVQLEVGTVATPFERQLYNAQLAQCQRYYWQTSGGQFVRFALIYADSTTSGQFIVSTPVPLRAAPTFLSANLTVNGVAITSVIMAAYSNGLASLSGNVASGLSTGTVYQLYTASGQTGTIALSAEL